MSGGGAERRTLKRENRLQIGRLKRRTSLRRTEGDGRYVSVHTLPLSLLGRQMQPHQSTPLYS